MRRAGAGAALLAALVLLAGCGPKPAVDPLGHRSAEELAEALAVSYEDLRTVVVDVSFTFRSADGTQEESCRGAVSWAGPERLRVRGWAAAFFTVFDLVSVGPEVRFDLPRENVFVFGDARDPGWGDFPLVPDRIRAALFAHPCPAGDCLQDAWLTAGDADTLSWGEEKLAIDPGTTRPLAWFAPGVETRWEGWQGRGGREWPERVVFRALDGAELEVSLGRIQVNPRIPDSRFTLPVESGREILAPADAALRWDRLQDAAVQN